MKRYTFFFAGIFLFLATAMYAQSYKTGVGARLGFFNGVTVKHFITPTNAIEGILSFRWNGAVITGLYEWQKPLPDAPGLEYFLGVGAHIGFFNAEKYHWKEDDRDGGFTVIGADLTAGLEYTFPTAPFTIGLDYKPAFNFIGDNHFWGDGFGLSLRYNIR